MIEKMTQKSLEKQLEFPFIEEIRKEDKPNYLNVAKEVSVDILKFTGYTLAGMIVVYPVGLYLGKLAIELIQNNPQLFK